MEKYLRNKYSHQLSQLPLGKLLCVNNKNKEYNYLLQHQIIDGKTNYYHKYLDKSHLEFVNELKQRKFLEKSIAVMDENIKFQEKSILHYNEYDLNAIWNLMPKTYGEIPDRFFGNEESSTPSSWAEANFPSNPYTKGLIHKTSFGLLMRSKSELLIAEQLHNLNIPFRYEELLRLPNLYGQYEDLYPDFSFLSKENKKFYWEHCGLMGNTEYLERFTHKVAVYHKNGICISNNLILTTDTNEGVLDTLMVKDIIEHFILPRIF
ncbi:MAG: hypothetical protein RSC31_05885 [Anaerovoracaceae bacterium]